MPANSFDIIPSYQIDKLKWDNCIRNCRHGLIYASSVYLDHMADNWHGMVWNDYAVVMPVPWRKKFTIRYCYDVPFVQQLGWFGEALPETVEVLLKRLFRFVQYGDYNFNFDNCVYTSEKPVNYMLHLKGAGNDEAFFTKPFFKKLQLATRLNLLYKTASPGEAIQLFRENYHSRMKNVSEQDYKNFLELARFFEINGQCIARKIETNEGEVVSTILLFKDQRRLYNLMNTTNEAGRSMKANYLLFYQLFAEFGNSGLIFDFEGSDIPGVKMFYQKFNVINQPYSRLHFNCLPRPLKWFKK